MDDLITGAYSTNPIQRAVKIGCIDELHYGGITGGFNIPPNNSTIPMKLLVMDHLMGHLPRLRSYYIMGHAQDPT
jgi:hypothetical protein